MSEPRSGPSRESLLSFIQSAPAAIALLRGPEHVFELTNPSYDALVGHRKVLGLTAREALPEVEGQGFFEALDGVFASGEPFLGNEMRLWLEDEQGGRESFVNFVYQPTRGPDGEVEGIAAHIIDVTSLVAARAAAERSEQRFRQMFDAMPQLGWTARPDGYIDFYNRGWYDYTGATPAQMAGWGWKSVHDPEIVEQVVTEWQSSIDTGLPFEMEFPLRGRDRVFRWFLTRARPVRGPGGKVERWVGVNTDIHDIRAARALAAAVVEQSRETEEAIRALRARIAELESAIPGIT